MPQQQEGADDDRGKRAPKERKKSCGRGRPGLDLVVIDNGSKRIKCLVGSVTLAKWTGCGGPGCSWCSRCSRCRQWTVDLRCSSCAGGSSRWQHRHTLHTAHLQKTRQASFRLLFSLFFELSTAAISTTYLLYCPTHPFLRSPVQTAFNTTFSSCLVCLELRSPRRSSLR